MSNICIRVSDYVSPFASSLPKIQSEDIIYVDRFEPDSYDHWMFGKSNASLTGKINNLTLTAQPSTVYPASFSDQSVNISAAKGNSLQTQLNDADSFTMACLVKVYDSNLRVLIGNLSSNDLEASGIGLFASAGKIYLTARGGASSVTDNATIDVTKPVFVAFSFNKAESKVNIISYQNGVFGQLADRASVLTPSNEPLSFGNRRYTTSAIYNTLKNDFYEGIVFNKALSIDEMKAMAMRVKTRQAHYGLDF